MKTITLGFLAAVIAASSAMAGDEVTNKDYKQPVAPMPCFRDQEFQVDIFGSYLGMPNLPEYRDSLGGPHHDKNGGGGGVGLNYFFMRYIGVGADVNMTSNVSGLANYTGKLIFRYPIQMGGMCLAPYVFGGGGGESILSDEYDFIYNYNFHHNYGQHSVRDVAAWMCGGGLEFRFTPNIGVFAEGRYTWTDSFSGFGDNVTARVGLRVAF